MPLIRWRTVSSWMISYYSWDRASVSFWTLCDTIWIHQYITYQSMALMPLSSRSCLQTLITLGQVLSFTWSSSGPRAALYGLSLGLRIKDSRCHCLACGTLCKPANIFLSKKQTQRKISQGVAAFPLIDLFYHHHGNNHRHYHSNGNSVTVVVSLIGKLVSLDNPRVLVEIWGQSTEFLDDLSWWLLIVIQKYFCLLIWT